MNESVKKFLTALEPIVVSVLKTLLKVAGFKGWLAGLVVKEFFEELAIPVINAGVVEIGYQLDVIDGKKMLKKIKEASNGEEYDHAADDVLGAR